MPPGSPIPRSIPEASEQIAAVANVSPQHRNEEIAKQPAGIYSSSSESDFLSVDFMPELIDFSDDFFASSLSSGSYFISSLACQYVQLTFCVKVQKHRTTLELNTMGHIYLAQVSSP